MALNSSRNVVTSPPHVYVVNSYIWAQIKINKITIYYYISI